MKTRKKQYILIGILIACAGILGAVTFSQKSPQEYASVSAESNTKQITATAASNAVDVQPLDSVQQGKEASIKTAVIQYLSTNKEGIIGSYAGKQLDNPSDNIFTISIDQTFSENDKVWLSYELEGVSDYTNVPKSINDRLATGGYLVKLSDKSALQREQLNIAWLKKGDNQIQFSLPENAEYGYKVKNLSIEVEKGANQSPLIVNATQTSYDNKAYVHGFIQDKNIAGSKIYVDGKHISTSNGEFETVVPLNANRTVNVKAILANGKEVNKEINFTNGASADIEYAMNNNAKQTSKTFKKGIAEDLKLETALLNVDSKALLATKDISITTLRHIDLPALDMAMSNVTASHKGYRFLPHGEHFADGAKVTIKYDRTKLPNGYTEDDIKTYYFDLDTKHWVALKRDTIDKKNQLIVSTTTHFTDMINGVIQTPESPETQGFAPTMMNDIKAADPTAKVQVIAPPAANNRGSAGLSYGFEMPPARNGMQPSLGIQYNSDGGAGWLGEGWDLSTPSISIDTRWGVPRYDDAKETETYSMGGSLLMMMDDAGQSAVAHRGDKINRKADRQFYPRNEGGFSKIIRKGSSPANYTWEVTDKSGTKYTYGAVLKGSAKTLSGNKDVIVEWKLSRIEELHGDYIEYIYETVDEVVKGSLIAKAIYLKEVRAGNKGSDPHTVVTLTSTTQKDKKTNSARYGFLTSSNKLLNKVDIAFEGQTLRSYTFAYKSGAFNTNILDKVTHLDAYGAEFASHTMEYYDDVRNGGNYKPFKTQSETWNLNNDGIDAGFINPMANLGVSGFSDKATALGGSKTTSMTISAYVGVGIGSPISKELSAGASYSRTSSTTQGLATLVDINGDGLPDKVYKKGNSVYYRPNISQNSDSQTQYGEEIKIAGISNFSRTKATTNTFGPKAYVPYASTGSDVGKTTSKTDIYFSDLNNDGLLDVVIDGKVYFNHIVIDSNGRAVPTFTLSSGDTPSPISGGGVIDLSDTEIDPGEQAELIANSPLQDVVRVWQAPFAGTIKVEGRVQLQAPQAGYDEIEYEKADGVRIAIQSGNTERWNKTITKGDFSSYAANVSAINVTKGQRIYFRVQSGANEMANGAFDQVKWTPVISYTDRTNQMNPNGQGTAVYTLSETDYISIESPNYIPSASSATVSGTFIKPVTSDNITLKAVLSTDETIDDGHGNAIANPAYQQVTVYQRTFNWNETYNGNLSFNVNNSIAGENLQLLVVSETNVAIENIKWSPVIAYLIDGSAVSSAGTVAYSAYSTMLSEGQPYNLTVNNTIKVEPKFSGLPTIPDITINGKLLMAVKNVNGLLAKQEVNITNGVVTPASIINSVAAQAGSIWVEYYISDTGLFSRLGIPQAVITANAIASTVTANTFTARSNDGYGIMHRGWGQFVYNAADGRYGNPIDESLLVLPQTEAAADPMKMVFMPMSPDSDGKKYWMGQTPDNYIKGSLMSSSRLGEQDVVLTNPLADFSNINGTTGSCIEGSGASAPVLQSKSSSTGYFLGGGIGPVSGNISTASGWENTQRSFTDMNGDGFPDIITENQIQYTNRKGGFDGEVLSGNYTHYSKNSSKSGGAGGGGIILSNSNTSSGNATTGTSTEKKSTGTSSGSLWSKITAYSNAAKTSVENGTNKLKASGSLDGSLNNDETSYTLLDVNGDGLPDKINADKTVQINLGYGFTDPIDWSLDKIQEGKSTTISAGGGLGYDIKQSSFSGGFGITTTTSSVNYMLLDVNSDGLPDKVWEDGGSVYVSLNTGNGFSPEFEWAGMERVNKTASTSESANVAVTFGFVIPFTPIKIVANPGGSIAQTMSRSLYDIRDIDGDGFPEIVSSDEDGKMTVYRSTIARTNKLKSVNNPLGGSFTVDYDRSLATYDHPGGKWVMKSVEINDGILDDGANMKTIFEYADGKQERHEREFLGFGKVITKNIDTESTDADKVYRKAIQEYDVNSVYTAGNQKRSVVEDASGNKFTESVNEYHSYKVTASADTYSFVSDNSICSDRAITFTPMKYAKSVVYEGQADGMTANESYYEYYLDGYFGDLKSYKYSDKGALGNAGTGAFNYQTFVEYTNNLNKHILGLPVKVQVKGSDGKLYRQTEAAYDLAYANHLTKVTQTLDEGGNKAEIDIAYDKYGNITRKTLPANSKGQRMFYKYLYDRDYNMYVERVEDAFGYRSEMENYDYRFGIPLTTRDMNGYTLESTIDQFGRVETITGPNEQVLGLPYTIKFEYHPQIVKDATGIKSPAYAVTKHYDPQNPTDDLETVTFTDGFGRAIQVKKDGVITETTNGTNPVDKKVMIVSGRAKFDPFGRVREAFYPVSENMGSKTVFNPAFDGVTPTKSEYDIMDRAIKTILPDNSESLMAYTKDNSSRTLVTTVTDAMGGKQSTFTNGSGLTIKTEQLSGPDGTITTRFEFDPINQLLKAIDSGNNETVSAYDMAGRRTQVIHPASGVTNLKYDNASNLLSKQTANLEEEGKFITYDYEYSRLLSVNYPDHPENNVKYSYGNKNASHNRVGRLMLQEDATGAQEFFYGRLGEMTKVKRTVIIPNQAIATYVTQWKYDSWNRIEEMIYPDGEKISYNYNTAGLLESMKGEKAYSYNYVNKLGYDKFEQRIYMKYCNGAETNYSYDAQRRRLSNLMVISGKDTRKQIMNNAYSYDKVDNVLSVINTAPAPVTGMGGQMSHTYNYDGLYRLQSATGTYQGTGTKTASYTLEMAYDNLHNITSKKQHMQQQGIQFDGILKAGYDLSYAYSSEKPHQITNLKDENYRTEGDAAKDKITKDHAYEYDPNGNLVYVNTAREKQDGQATQKANERKLLWDEENRLQAINDNGFISGYWYDASGERVVKTSGDDEGIYVNDVFSGGRTQTANFTAYINPYLVVSKGGQYTKHIYIGSQRIVSKLGDLDSYGQDPRRVEYAGSEVDGAKVDYKAKYQQSQQTIKDRYAYFEVAYYGKDNDDYVNGGGFCCNDNTTLRSFDPSKNDNPELYQFYYHSDHLGSSSLITNLDGEIVQHIEYVPFGEVFIEERNNKWNTPFLFNAKELDEETGLYYYGARYYDPRTSVWISTDPLQEKYPSVSSYAYCYLSPIRYFDPTGMGPWDDLVAWGNRNSVGTRSLGGLKMVGGAVEALAGGTFAVVTSETVVGAVAGAAVFVHGSDVASAGLRQMLSGQDESSLTSQGLQAVGMSKQKADLVDGGISILGTFGTSTWANSSKIATSSNTVANNSSNYSKLLQSSDDFDPIRTIYRGTTGSEGSSSVLFATDNASVAASYVKNGGQVVEYQLSLSGLKTLEYTGELTYKVGLHGVNGAKSTEYMFQGRDLIKALNEIAKPIN